ncbi:MAG: sigma-70 family RNA polymerase sigma factor [Planctomycetota bacterium]
MTPATDSKRELFEQVAIPHMKDVYHFAFSLARDGSVAEDLAQQTFLNAFRSFERFKIGSHCKAWLFKICKTLFIDRCRARGRRPQETLEMGEIPSEDPDRSIRAFERHGIDNEEIFLDLFGDEVNRYLADLPEGFRRALLLCDVDGLAYEQIAELLEVPIGTVRSRISRARAFLRERLEEYARELGYLKGTPEECDER